MGKKIVKRYVLREPKNSSLAKEAFFRSNNYPTVLLLREGLFNCCYNDLCLLSLSFLDQALPCVHFHIYNHLLDRSLKEG